MEELLLIRLEASAAVLRARIASREPPEWADLPKLLDAAEKLGSTMRALRHVDLVFSTDDRQPRTVAAMIRDTLPRNGAC